MPQYAFDDGNNDDVPRFGRPKAKDLKVYRTRKGLCGPTLITKCIWHMDSYYKFYDFFDGFFGGQFKNNTKKIVYPSLLAALKMPLACFDLPYSVNKYKNWEILEKARKSILSLQDRSISLRVSVCNRLISRQPIYWKYTAMGNTLPSAYDDRISEFHAYNDDGSGELHIHSSTLTFEDILRPQPIEPRKRRQRYRPSKFQRLHLDPILYGAKADALALDQRRTHIVYTQHSFSRSRRLLNMKQSLVDQQINKLMKRFQMYSMRSVKKRARKLYRHDRKKRKAISDSFLFRHSEDIMKPIVKHAATKHARKLSQLNDIFFYADEYYEAMKAAQMNSNNSIDDVLFNWTALQYYNLYDYGDDGMDMDMDVDVDMDMDVENDYNNIDNDSDIDEIFKQKPHQMTLEDYFVPITCKETTKKKAAALPSSSSSLCRRSHSPEYLSWYRSSPSVDFNDNVEHANVNTANKGDEAASASANTSQNAQLEMLFHHQTPSLASFVIELNDEQTRLSGSLPDSLPDDDDDDDEHQKFSTIARRLMPYSSRLADIRPEIFMSRLERISDELKILLPKTANSSTDGYIFMQQDDASPDNNIISSISLRCILNTSKGTFDESSDETCSQSAISENSSKLVTSLWRFIAPNNFAPTKSYSQKIADNIASYQLLSDCRYNSSTNMILSSADLPSTSSSPSQSSSSASYCVICDSFSDDGFALRCSHWYCRECWTSHASSTLQSGTAPIICPAFRCNQALKLEHLLMLLPISICQLYKRLLATKCMLLYCKNWIHCTNCSNVLRIAATSTDITGTNTTTTTATTGTTTSTATTTTTATRQLQFCSQQQKQRRFVSCECGAIVCLKCKQYFHEPLLCDEAKQYSAMLQANGQLNAVFDEGRSVLVKRCPFCGTFCERSEGCNHMQCICGESFCYVCSGKWDDSGHYGCEVDVSVRVNLFDVSEANAARLSLKTLDKCFEYRRLRSSSHLFRLEKKLTICLNDDFAAIRHVLSVYATVCEVLEMSTLGVYLFKRHSKPTQHNERRPIKRMKIMIGILNVFKDRLQFLQKRLVAHCDAHSSKTKIHQLCDAIAYSLTDYMHEVL